MIVDTDKLEKLIEESRNDLKETLDNVKKVIAHGVQYLV